MKKLSFFALMGLSLCSMAQKKGFEIKGKVGNWNAPVKAYLYYTAPGTSTGIMDSAKLTNGEFRLKGMVDEPVVAALILDEAGIGLSGLNDLNSDFTRFYLDNEVITISSKDSVKKAAISGSVINDESAGYSAFIQANTKRSSALQTELAGMTAEKQHDPEIQKSLQQHIQEAREELRGALISYIEQHPSSYFSLLALSNLVYIKTDAEKAANLYKKVPPGLQGTVLGKKTAKEIEQLRTTSIGAMAPLFTQPDTSGAPISLSGFSGKYVLIDFWASWAGPSRLENPGLVKIYKKYHTKGLEILGVSLDGADQRSSWLGAIRKDSLPWTQVSDLKGGDNAAAQLYGVQSIPQNFLIDPNGKIIALSLSGEALDKKMKEIFTK